MFNNSAKQQLSILGMEIYFDSSLEETVAACSLFDASDADSLSLGLRSRNDGDEASSFSSGSESSDSSLSSSEEEEEEEEEEDAPSRTSISLGRLNQLYDDDAEDEEDESDREDDDDSTLGGKFVVDEEYSYLALSRLDLSDMAVKPKRKSQPDKKQSDEKAPVSKQQERRERRTRRRSKGSLQKKLASEDETKLTLKGLTFNGALAQTA
ncbi:expressed unknown protein [Seminavis robusta]|uniref:Uncharacterized protein n=1 Tax=Seminavis robusta TaxID=568900 RepID=A0A9N8HJ49_9STRA|nr:expressed unknown protein [Seminavis robusta]|eukprot:Sro636_g179260.1 n/a (210) ;mRNA; r:22659-23288